MPLHPQFLLSRVSAQLPSFSPNTLPGSLGLTHFSFPAQKTSYLSLSGFPPTEGVAPSPGPKRPLPRCPSEDVDMRAIHAILPALFLPWTPHASGQLCHIHLHITNWDIKQSEIKDFKTIWQMAVTGRGSFQRRPSEEQGD